MQMMLLSSAVAVAVAIHGAFAQTLEVASLQEHTRGARRGFVRPQPDGLAGENVTLKQLIRHAYELLGVQIAGPDWIVTEGYDLEIKATARITPEQGRLALQRLLSERFRLQSHEEKVSLPGYRLMVSGTGAKLRDAQDEEAFRAAHAGKPPFKEGWTAIFTGKTLPGFAERLGRAIGRIIVDDTGISGSYWFQLEWVPDPDQPGGDGPSLRAAIQQQLGLKLVEESVPSVLMIVDSVAKPKH